MKELTSIPALGERSPQGSTQLPLRSGSKVFQHLQL